MEGVSDSIGPVKPRITPSLISSADAAPASSAPAADAKSSFFIWKLPIGFFLVPNVSLCGVISKEKRSMTDF
jgi:hypothetical protein